MKFSECLIIQKKKCFYIKRNVIAYRKTLFVKHFTLNFFFFFL
jgi:hypothetical protein